MPKVKSTHIALLKLDILSKNTVPVPQTLGLGPFIRTIKMSRNLTKTVFK